jgi:anti-sigma-K factor RskA
MKPYYGVGSYRFPRDEVITNKKGKQKRITVWEEVTVNDRPRSLGVLENELVNATLEMAAIRSYKATIVTIY